MNKILLACCLGDGYLSSDGTLDIRHQAKQKEYLEYKASLFNKQTEIREINNNGYLSYQFRKGTFNNHDCGREVRKKLYGVMGHKYYSEDIVREMDEFCIAILYCDDGSLIPKKQDGMIHAYNLTISLYASYQECERIVDKIYQLFGVKFKICKDKNKFLIRCGTKEARKFIPQIKKYIPNFECFKNNKLKDEILTQCRVRDRHSLEAEG